MVCGRSKASALRIADLGSKPAFPSGATRLSHMTNLLVGTLAPTLAGTWRYRVSEW